MGHLTYEESKSKALKIIIILAIMTFAEVVFALYSKGHLIEGQGLPGWLLAIVMITMSILKAYLIVYEFMHMKYEISGMVKSVLLPMLLLVWGMIAFFWEGSDWGRRRGQIQDFNKEKVETIKVKPVGHLTRDIGKLDFNKG